MISKRFPVGMLWTNCYVVSSSDGRAVVIDPGGEMDDVRRYIADSGLELDQILLTHGHGDHIFGLGEIRGDAAHGVAICPPDAQCIVDAQTNLSDALGNAVAFDPAERMLSDGEELRFGEMSARVITTPGHTRGSCCFLMTEGDEKMLISGDTLFARSIGRTDLEGGSEEELIASLRKLAPLDDDTPVLPGHGPATTIGEERSLNPFWPR